MPADTEEERVRLALRRAGGEATMSALVRDLGVYRGTIRRWLAPLLEDGSVESPARGRYRLADLPALRSESGAELAAVLERSGFEAHVTGFDVLVPFAHQFVYRFPHLVYADPSAVNAVETELTKAGFVVTHAGPHRSAAGPDLDRVVVLRAQPAPDQYGVHGVVARVEKAWVDALRETVRGNLDLSYLELGRILRGLVDDGADLRYLRRYARQLGYLSRLDNALNPEAPAGEPDAIALQAGYWA